MLVSDRRFRILTPVDDFTRDCLDIVADTSLTRPWTVRELNAHRQMLGSD